MKRLWLFLALLVVGIVASPAISQVTPCSNGGTYLGDCTGSGTAVYPAVTATTRTIGNSAMSSNFAGFSYEKSVLNDYGLLTTSNTAMVQLFQNLGTSCIVRIGGGSTEAVNGNPMLYNASGSGGTLYQIAPTDISNLNGFLSATGCKAIYAIAAIEPRNTSQTTALMGAEAAQVTSTLGSNLYAFELGNEIDASGDTATQAVTALQQVASAIATAAPSAPIECPDVSFYPGTIPSVVMASMAPSCSAISAHYYLGNGQATPTPTIAQMLAGDPSSAFSSLVGAVVSQNTLGALMTESGTFYNSGAPGTSNSAASALEDLSFIFKAHVQGLSGIKFHGGATSYYAPINDNALNSPPPNIISVNAGYYALWAYDQQSGCTLTTKNFTPTFFWLETYYANSCPGGGSWLTIINKSAWPVGYTYNVGVTINSANAYLYTAPLPSSTSGMTIAGGSVSPSTGSWSPSPSPVALTPSGTTVPVLAPAYTFTIVHLQ